jgi:hypothetical protein
MNPKEFDEKFQELCAKLVYIAYDHVNRNKDEVDAIYAFASYERGNHIFYSVFYKINGQLVKLHKINTVSKQQYDVSSDNNFALLDKGIECQKEIKNFFEKNNQKLPSLIKVIYDTKTGEFKLDISYELQYTKKGKYATDVCDDWFMEMEANCKPL